MEGSDKQQLLERIRGAKSLDVSGILGQVSAHLRADREVVLAAATHSGHALHHASAELRADREVVLAAVARSTVLINTKSRQYGVSHRTCRILLTSSM
eukprot:COSAG01_NODE_6458_length_3659_cov_8.235526_4_plen_98_part_00